MPRRKSKVKADEPLRPKEYLQAIGRVIKISFKISPFAIVFKIISGIFDSVIPLATAYFAGQTITEITRAFTGVPGAKNKALLYVSITAAIGILSTLQTTIGGYIDQVIRFKVESKVSDMLYEHFIRLAFWHYEDKKTTDLYSKAQEFTSFFAYVFDRVMSIFSALFGMISAILGLGLISHWLSVIFVFAILPGLAIQYKLSRLNIEHWHKNVTARRKQSFIEYNMIQPQIISELRLYNLAHKMLELRVHFRNKDHGARLEFEKQFIGWRFLADFIEAVAQLATLIWVVIKIAAQVLPIGQFIYIQQLVSRALSSASRLVSEYGSADEDLAKLKDYNDFMQLPVADKVGRKAPKKVDSIRFENVSFMYPHSEKAVLKDITFEITKGDHIAVVGENGAGKTTLVKLLLGFYAPSKGTIYVNDVPLSEYDISSWHRHIGVLLQSFTSFQFLTAGENVTFGDVGVKPTLGRINEALDAAEAKEVVDGLPRKLQTPLAPWLEEDGATDLSGGQWQRIGLARNFYRQAPIIVLDEPTSAIDALAEAKIFDRLFNKKNNQTLIAISHRLTTIEQADMIYVFDSGRIIQKGTHEALAAQKHGQYVRMFRRQLKQDKASP